MGKIYNKTEFGVETINNKLHGFTDYEGNTIFKNEYKEIIFFYNKIIGIKDKFSVIYNPKTKQSQTINHEFDLLNSEDRKIIIKQ